MDIPVPHRVIEQASSALRDQGWWAGTDVVEEELVTTLRCDLHDLIEHDRLHRAGIGRDRDFQLDREIRSDRVFWLNRRHPVQQRFLEQMENLRLTLNRELLLGLFEFECHYAHYPPGGHYKRHYDSFRGGANRIVSLVAYLTENWQSGDGGELVLYAEDDAVLATIEPRAGSLALFLSEEIPHEVLPAANHRMSIAGWFRLNTSIGGQLDPPR